MASDRALLQFLLSLPSGTSAATGFSTAVELYAEVRASYLKNSLAPLTKHVSDTANGVQSVSVHGPREAVVVYTRGSARLGEWLQALVQMTQKEHDLLSTLLKDLGQEYAGFATSNGVAHTVHDQSAESAPPQAGQATSSRTSIGQKIA